MSFPLFTETYEINGRVYRRNPVRGGVSGSTVKRSAAAFADTPDLYADDVEDEPADCGVTSGAPVATSETYEDEPPCQKSSSVKENSKKTKVDPKEGKKEETRGGKDGETGVEEATEDERVKVVHGKSSSKWIASITVPPAFMGRFLGHNRKATKALEDETNCRLRTPRREESKPIEITSFGSLECVQRCLDRIELFLIDSRKTARVTHFIALRCDDEEVMTSFGMFRDAVLEGHDISCKNEKLFTSPHRLHLTLTVLWIFDESEMKRVAEVLEGVGREVREMLQQEAVIADIQGIETMNDDPSHVSVLYARVGGEKVQKIANLVRDRLVESKFAKAENADVDVKLHMTLMNARYITQADNSLRGFSFDATSILEELREFYFGTIRVNEICLCSLNSNAPSNIFYPRLATIKLS